MFCVVPNGHQPDGRRPEQLPPGRHGYSRSFVQQNQRRRILTAVAETTARLGYAETSVEDVIASAGVSRRTFYEHFKNKHEAFLAAYDEAAELAVRRVVRAVEDADGFAGRTGAGLAALLHLLAAEPALAHMCVVDVMAAGPDALARRGSSMRTFAEIVERYAEELVDGAVPFLTAQTIVGGIYEVVYSRVLGGAGSELPSLLPDLAYSVMLPYLGQAAALEERRRMQDGLTTSD
jgi:AcrR family transcriptional regulator